MCFMGYGSTAVPLLHFNTSTKILLVKQQMELLTE